MTSSRLEKETRKRSLRKKRQVAKSIGLFIQLSLVNRNRKNSSREGKRRLRHSLKCRFFTSVSGHILHLLEEHCDIESYVFRLEHVA